MPPKKEITYDFILKKAYEITRENGFESISARSLARELHCSTQPIYHEFSDMQNLKLEITKMAWARLIEFIQTGSREDVPEDLQIILNYIRFALQEKKLFQLIIGSGMLCAGSSAEALSSWDHPPDQKMIIFANGIIMMIAFNTMGSSWEAIKALTTEAYEAFRKAEENH